MAGVLTSAWWSHQLTGNVVTVAQGASTKQFVKLATNELDFHRSRFCEAGTRLATARSSNIFALCATGPAPNTPNYPLSRGWKYTATMSFDLTNAGGDVEHYGALAAGLSNQRQWQLLRATAGLPHLTTWDFPQNKSGTPSITVQYTTGTGARASRSARSTTISAASWSTAPSAPSRRSASATAFRARMSAGVGQSFGGEPCRRDRATRRATATMQRSRRAPRTVPCRIAR